MNFRLERVNSEIKTCVADIILHRIKDPRVSGMVSVMQVDTSKDLKSAKVFVSIYGDEDKVASTFDALKQSAGFVRRELSFEMKELRVVPQIHFCLDTSMRYSQKINTILEGIKHEDN